MRNGFWLLCLVTALGFATQALAQQSEDEGPTILSRNIGHVFNNSQALATIRPYISIDGIYDTGLTPVSVDPYGKVPDHKDYGGELAFGVLGSRRWRYSYLAVDYRGSVRKYDRRSYYDGSDHSLGIGFTRLLGRRARLTLRQSGGIYSRGFAVFGGWELIDPSFATVPIDELFDSRTYYLTPMADLTFVKSPRLSFNIGASGAFVRRRSAALVGTNGYTARADVAYRLTRRTTIGFDYSYSHYEFTSGLGTADYHTGSVDLASRIGRSWELALRAGVGRAETLSFRRIALDPILAAIIGQRTMLIGFYNVQYMPHAGARLSKVFGSSVVSVDGGVGFSPGNGFYLASKRQHLNLGFSHATRRRLNVGLWGGYSGYKSLGRDLNYMRNYYAGGGMTVRLSEALHWSAGYSARLYEIQGGVFDRFHHRVQVGFAVSPGERPLRLW